MGASRNYSATVGYSSSMTVALGFDAKDFATPPEGFGFLVPRKERRRLVACTWVGTKFSNRVSEGKIVARCFRGGAADAAALDESDEAIIAAVTSDLQEIAGITARARLHPHFAMAEIDGAIHRGPRARMAEVTERLAAIPGLYLAGNAYTGIGIPDCIRMGKAAAEEILKASQGLRP